MPQLATLRQPRDVDLSHLSDEMRKRHTWKYCPICMQMSFATAKASCDSGPAHEQAAHDWKVEGVEGCLVGHYPHVCLLCVFRQIHCPDGRCCDVQKLSVGCLMRRLRMAGICQVWLPLISSFLNEYPPALAPCHSFRNLCRPADLYCGLLVQ